ncbi:agamous-like MADS-box protein AGL80 [Lolium perenne]|uniref:agamous-like MADS-box protein AGL80 n=1 Tax=Lolium perenne TaxID=4522 RepID=UPI0021F50C11|nr:agamous-like MADS-box protein AGL19 [Lolium perenne]
MVRSGRTKLQYIVDRKERKRTLEKRLPNLLKKTREFAVLCDVPTSLVVYCPGDDHPVVWPSPDVAADLLRRYNELGNSQRLKHRLDGAEFIGKLVDKAKAELSTVQREIRGKEMDLLLGDFFAGRRGSFDDMSPEVSAALESTVEKKLRTVKARLQELHGGAVLPPLPTQLVQPQPLLQDDVQFHQALDASDGSGLPTTEELQAVFMKSGIFTAPQPSPSVDDIV